MNETILIGLNDAVNASSFYGKEQLSYRIWIQQNCLNFQNINSGFIQVIFYLLYYHIYFYALSLLLSKYTWKSNYFESPTYLELKGILEKWHFKNKINTLLFKFLMSLNKWFFTFSPVEFNPFKAISDFLFIFIFVYTGVSLFIRI